MTAATDARRRSRQADTAPDGPLGPHTDDNGRPVLNTNTTLTDQQLQAIKNRYSPIGYPASGPGLDELVADYVRVRDLLARLMGPLEGFDDQTLEYLKSLPPPTGSDAG